MSQPRINMKLDESSQGPRNPAIARMFLHFNHQKKFRSETSDSIERWKSRRGKSQRGEEKKWEDQRRKKMQVREKVGKSRLSVFFEYFPMICGSGGSKRRPAKAAGAEPCCQMRDKKMHDVVARSTFPSQNVQFTSASGLFVKLRCWKSVRRCGAKQISKWKCTKEASFGALLEVELSKKCTPWWREAHVHLKMYKAHHDQFWKLRCRKSARRCGAKHISKSKCTKHTMTSFGSWDVGKVHAVVARSNAKHISKWKCTKHLSIGALFEVAMSKRCTALWRETHCQAKMYKTHQNTPWPVLEVEMSKSARRCGAKHISKWKCTKHLSIGALFEVAMSKKCTALWREAHFQVKMYKAHHDQFWKLRCRKSARRCGTKQCEAHFQIKMHKRPHVTYGPLFDGWDVVLRRRRKGLCTLWKVSKTCSLVAVSTTTTTTTTIRYTTLPYNRLHYTALHYTTLHPTTPHYTTLHYTTLHYITLLFTTLHYITLHYTTLQ